MQAINDIQADSDLAITSSADGTALAWYRRPPPFAPRHRAVAVMGSRRADPRVCGLRCRDVGTGSLLHQVARYEGEIVQARLASLTTLVTASGTYATPGN
jgi:hypothetical protein